MFQLLTKTIVSNVGKNSLNNIFTNNSFKNKRFFCNVGKPIGINQLKQSFSELLKLDYKKTQEEGLPKNLLDVQNDILKSNEKELDTQTRMISSIFLWRSLCFLNQTPNVINNNFFLKFINNQPTRKLINLLY